MSLFGRKNSDKRTVSLYIIIRVTGAGEKRISTGITLPVENFKNARITGRSAQIAELQKRVEIIGSQLEKAFWEVYESDVVPTPDSVIAQMERSKNSHMTLLTLMDKVVALKETMFKSGQATPHLVEKFKILKDNVEAFIKVHYRKPDIFLQDVKIDFVENLAAHLLRIPNSNITVNKKMSNLSQAFIYAVNNDWMAKNPIKLWKPLTETKTNREFLTLAQFKQLLDFELPNDSFEVVKDSMIFMCLTGMAFSDMSKFKMQDVRDIGGSPFIVYKRKKLLKYDKDVFVPVVPKVMEIIQKHYKKPIRKGKREKREKTPTDPVFNVQANQIYNGKIKSLFEFNNVTVDFSLVSHTGRKTFGNLITKKLGIETASQMLGHSSIQVTEESYVDNSSEQLLQDRAKNYSQFYKNELEQ